MKNLNKLIYRDLLEEKSSLAEDIMIQIFKANPSLVSIYTKEMENICIQDLKYHLEHLAEAIYIENEGLFVRYISWTNSVLEFRGIPKKQLVLALNCMKTILNEKLEENNRELSLKYIDAGIDLLTQEKPIDSEIIKKTYIQNAIAEKYLKHLLAAERREANDMILRIISEGKPIKEVFLEIFQPVQYEIGRLWQTNKISVAQEHYGTACTQSIISSLYPRILSTEKVDKTMVATCISNELHELGIRMVADFFEMEGWDTYYLGANTPMGSIIDYLVLKDADLLGVSATLMKHISLVEKLIQKIKSSEAKAVKVIVGGYPFNLIPDLWKRIGADGFAKNAIEAVKIGGSLTSGS